jgi:hypothetical protein
MDEEEQWLQEDDCKSRHFRAVRMREAIELFPIPEGGLITFGGLETITALVEARLAYVNGLYFCTILLPSVCWNAILRECFMRRALNRQNG